MDTWVVSCRYNRLVGQNATSLSRRFTRLHGLQPLLLTELSAMDQARKTSLTTLTTLAHRCTTVTQAFVDQVLCRLLIIKPLASHHPCELRGLSICVNVCTCIRDIPLALTVAVVQVLFFVLVCIMSSGNIAPHTLRNGW